MLLVSQTHPTHALNPQHMHAWHLASRTSPFNTLVPYVVTGESPDRTSESIGASCRDMDAEAQHAAAAALAGTTATETQVCDLPEVCLAQAIARTSPLDACRCAAVSPAFRAAADSDDVWRAFLPSQLLDHRGSSSGRNKDAYLGLCDAASAVPIDIDGEGCRVWLERATGARCYALAAKRLSLPWDDGEYSWRFTHHPRSRFAEVAELVECTCLEIYGQLPASLLTPATTYAAYLVYSTAPEGSHRGLSYLDQETAVAVGGRVVARHAVCLRPDDAEARKFRGRGAGGTGGGEAEEEPRRPRIRDDGWWEMEIGRLRTPPHGGDGGGGEVVQASFEVLGWYPKRGLVVEGIEFRPVHDYS